MSLVSRISTRLCSRNMPCEKERNVSLRAKACWKGREKGSKKRKEREGRGKERKRKRRKNGGLVKRRKDVNKGNLIRNFFFHQLV